MTVRERVARAWHEGSDHADHSPFGGPLCSCWQVTGRIMPMLSKAWAAGQEAGINDDLGDWEVAPSITRNPYETRRTVMSTSDRQAKYKTLVHARNRNSDYGIPVDVYAPNWQEAVNRAVGIGWSGNSRDARVTVLSVEDVPPTHGEEDRHVDQ